jgi:monothiol glutaredoxin
MNNEILEKIAQQIKENPVILYMKGEADHPQCGFSQRVVAILNQIGIPFKAINVLSNPEIRQGIKDYSAWPTIPQLYVNQEFIGGCDIVSDLYKKGELIFLFDNIIKKDNFS